MHALRDDLERLHWQVWMDHEIHGGEQWWREIIQTILATKVFVFALSDASWRSRPCQEELEYAKKLGIPVLPVQVGPVHNTRIPIMETQAIDYRERTPEAVLALIAALADLASRQIRLPDPLPDPPPVPFEYLYRMAERLGPKPIPADDQELLIGQFRSKLRNEDDDVARADIVKLLKELRRRRELTVGNAEEIDSLLETAELLVAEAQDGATRLPPTDHWRQGRAEPTPPPRPQPDQPDQPAKPPVPPAAPPPRVRKSEPVITPTPAHRWPSPAVPDAGVRRPNRPEPAKPAPAEQEPAQQGPARQESARQEPARQEPAGPGSEPRTDAAPMWLRTLIANDSGDQPRRPPAAAPAEPTQGWWAQKEQQQQRQQEQQQQPPPPPPKPARDLAFAGAVLGGTGIPFLFFAAALGNRGVALAAVVVLVIAVALGLSLALVSVTRRQPRSRAAVMIAAAGLVGVLAYAALYVVF